jgi:dipeptidyl aminopeptidase/acylaminoacyl peptidase
MTHLLLRAGAIVAITLALGASGRAAAGRAMTIDDLITAVRVSEPTLAPDGRTAVYVRTTTDGTTGKRNADIWSVATDGSAPPRALITGDGSETTPVFAANGARLAFLSSRSGTPQVFVARPDGTVEKQVTTLAAGAQGPLALSADGSRVVFVSDVFPDCADEACNAQRAKAKDDNPVKAHRVTRLLYRHWSEWREDVRHHIFVADVATGATRDLTPGDFDSPPYFYEDGGLALSPDGTQLAFVSNRDGNDVESWTTNQDVWIVPVSGGTARRLTTGQAADVQPVWMPDGRRIVTRSQRRPTLESDRWYLDVHTVAGGPVKTLFEAPDLSVENFALTPDGQTVLFTAQDRGVANLYKVPAAGGAPAVVAPGGAIGSIGAAGGTVLFSKSALTTPADLFTTTVAGGGATALTRENAGWLNEVAFTPAESLTVAGAQGAKIQYWLLKPPDFDPAKKYPVVFLIHGGPQGAWEDAWSYRWNPQLWAAQGWVVAAPNPRGSTGFGQKFVDEISGDWGGKVMIDLDAVVNTVAKLPYADNTRMGIAGASYGGYAVNWIIGHTNRFKAAVTHDGVYNLETMMTTTEELWFIETEMGGVPWSAAARENVAKWSPHRFAPQIKTPTLVITNELDYRVPVDQGLQLFSALRRQNVPAEMLVFPDEGHWVLKALNSRYWHQQVFGWMKRWLEAPAGTR